MIIDNFTLGGSSPTYLIAEISANHNGRIENAKEAIFQAKQAGANAVKLQTYTPDTLTIKSSRPEFLLSGGTWDGYQLYDLYAEAHTPFEWHDDLFSFARECEITLFSTPFDSSAVELLEQLQAPAYKIASFEIVDLPLIELVASRGKPLLISTGTATFEEISEALHVARSAGATEILLFHCISAYPAPLEESRLNTIKRLREKYNVLVGLSDHSIGVEAGFLSVALGAVAIEKHFTPSREIGGPDASFSATPEEFFALRQKLDLARLMLGEVSDDRSAFEDQSRGLRKSIYFVNDLKKGDQLTLGDVKVIRPGHGLHPRYFNDLDGAKLTRNVTYGEPVLKSDVNHSFDAEWFTSSDFRLQEIIPTSEQINILFELLKNRNQSTNISHEKQPSFKKHKEFVTSNPYRGWWLIYDEKRDDACLGSVYVGNDNSVGLHIALDRVAFSAEHFVEKLKCARKPLRPVKSKIGRDYFFNVSPNNHSLIQWLERSYFVEIQRSFFR